MNHPFKELPSAVQTKGRANHVVDNIGNLVGFVAIGVQLRGRRRH